MKKLILIIFFLIGIVKINAQSDHLEPVDGILNSYDFEFEYHTKIREILFDGLTDTPNIRFLTLPSFSPTYVLDIDKDNETKKYYLIYHKCKTSIWYNDNWRKIKVDKYKSELTNKSAELMIKLFKTAINQTKYYENELLGFDGTDYYFSVFDKGIKTGTVWSPNKKTRMGKLVEIGNHLIELVKQEKFKVDFNENLTSRIENLITEF